LRVRYAKRGRLRFTSHRDFARAFERALRRAQVPMAYSAGFSPHPKISYAGAAPTGVASEAEYLEIGLAAPREPDDVRAALDAALPPGLDIVDVVVAEPPGLPDRLEASAWLVELPEVSAAAARQAVAAFLAADSVLVERPTKDGHRVVDARVVVVGLAVSESVGSVSGGSESGVSESTEAAGKPPYAILELVMRHATPAVRPDDVLTALRHVSDLSTPGTPLVTRLAQGLLSAEPASVHVVDPLQLIDPLR
jgi:radical SAM-linked protein